MNYSSRFEIGTKHNMAKGTLIVKNYFEENNILYMTYILNNDTQEYTNKYVNIISIIYKYQKRHDLTTAETIEEFVELELKRDLKFGVEIELISPILQYQLIDKLIEQGIKISTPNSTHEVVTGWKLVYDSSIHSSHGYGMELVSPPSFNFDELKIVCNVLNEVGVKVNRSCGLHVHHDISDFEKKQIVKIYEFYNKYENLINSFLPKSRVNNRFCRPISNIINTVLRCESKSQLLYEIAGDGIRHYYDWHRYYTINLRSFLYYGTIEFRQAAGSIDFDTISNWVLFTHRIIEKALQIDNDIIPPTEEQLNNWNIKKNMLEDMIKELNIEKTQLENNLKLRLKKRGVA